MGYMVVAGKGPAQDKKRPVTAGNFHKTIPRVLINLSCSSVQVVDCLHRNFPIPFRPLRPSDYRILGATKMAANNPTYLGAVNLLAKKINTAKYLRVKRFPLNWNTIPTIRVQLACDLNRNLCYARIAALAPKLLWINFNGEKVRFYYLFYY